MSPLPLWPDCEPLFCPAGGAPPADEALPDSCSLLEDWLELLLLGGELLDDLLDELLLELLLELSLELLEGLEGLGGLLEGGGGLELGVEGVEGVCGVVGLLALGQPTNNRQAQASPASRRGWR